MTTATATLALAFGLGALIWLASHKVRIPPLIPLMLAGVALGDQGLGLVDPSLLGSGLQALITLSVAVLVFEGSLHLDQETLGHAPSAVRGLLSIGIVVTWVGVTIAAILLLGLQAPFAIILGSILIVTGPTVIQPLLQRVRLTPRLHAALLSEGILIDPIGVIAIVATLEIVLASMEARPSPGTLHVLWSYAAPFATGGAIGAALGLATRWLLSRSLGFGHEGDRTASMLALAACVVAVGVSDFLWHESGLVAAAVAGVIIARSLRRQLQPARRAAEWLAAMLVGLLFILLAATIDVRALLEPTWRDAAFVGAVMFVIRPLSVLAGTARSKLAPAERAYLALIAPRGIVAVSAAALVAAALAAASQDPAVQAAAAAVQRAVLLVVVATVLWAGLAGGLLAGLLRVRGPAGAGLIIAGAGKLGRDLALAVAAVRLPVRLVDTNQASRDAAEAAGLDVRVGDATDMDWMSHDVVAPQFGGLIAATGNPDVDRVVARWGLSAFGPRRSESLDGALAAGALSDRGLTGRDVLDMAEQGRLAIASVTDHAALAVPLVAVKGGRLHSVGDPRAEGADLLIGLVEPAAASPAT